MYLQPLIVAFKKNKNAKEAIGMKAYMLHQFKFAGIKSPTRDLLVKQFLKENKLTNYTDLNKVIKDMWGCKEREFQYAAIDVFAHHHLLWKRSSIKLIEYCIINKSWWDTVDGFGSDWIPTYFKLFPEQIIPVTSKWNQSNNIWLQRSSIMFQKKEKANTNTVLLSAYILKHAASKEFFIQKAIGWTLREYSKSNPDWVKQFVENNKLAPLSKREALKIINKQLF